MYKYMCLYGVTEWLTIGLGKIEMVVCEVWRAGGGDHAVDGCGSVGRPATTESAILRLVRGGGARLQRRLPRCASSEIPEQSAAD